MKTAMKLAVALLVTVPLVGSAHAAPAPGKTGHGTITKNLSPAAQSLFDYSMELGDSRYDAYYHHIWYADKGNYPTRFTAWYIPGLLYRAQGDDIEMAIGSIEALLAAQMHDDRDFNAPFYGTYKVAADSPTPTLDSPMYPPVQYSTYDPNWREFIGSQLVQIVAEFEYLLPEELVSRIVHSLEIASVGAMRRNGRFPEGDNLVLGYSNVQLMRNILVGWTGERLQNQTFIDFARTNGDNIYALFTRDGANTLGEFNSPTYSGMAMWALGAHLKYGPKDAPMTTHAGTMVTEIWKDLAARYNPFLGNLVGPYDRAYSRDGTMDHVVIAMYWWGLWGEEYTPSPPRGQIGVRYNLAQGAGASLIMDTLLKHIDPKTAEQARQRGHWKGTRSLNKTIWDDLKGNKKRIATSWIRSTLQIGAETVVETRNRGDQFVPAIVHWASDPHHLPYAYNGLIMFYPSASTIRAEAAANSLLIA